MDPGVRQDGPRVGEWWVTPETASRDKIELRAMLAPEEDYIYKELGVRLSLGAGKKGWLWAALPTGGVAAAIPGSEHMPGQGWVLGRRIQINTTNLPTSPYSQIPRKISLNWRGTWHDEWLLSHPPGTLALPCSLCGKKPGAWVLPLPVLSLPFQTGNLEVFSH